jgi:hypothetical protein
MRRLFPCITALVLSIPTIAAADETGASGRVVRLVVNAAGSDSHALFHGQITVRKSTTAGKGEVYQWGGTACPGSKLTDAQIALISDALHNRHRITVVPRYKAGEAAGTKCLTAFELVAG